MCVFLLYIQTTAFYIEYENIVLCQYIYKASHDLVFTQIAIFDAK